jgi:hypothetical protein
MEALWLIEGLRIMKVWELDDDIEAREEADRVGTLLAPAAGVGGTVTLEPQDVRMLADAADAYCYWEAAEPDNRDSGYVLGVDTPRVAPVVDLQQRLLDCVLAATTG